MKAMKHRNRRNSCNERCSYNSLSFIILADGFLLFLIVLHFLLFIRLLHKIYIYINIIWIWLISVFFFVFSFHWSDYMMIKIIKYMPIQNQFTSYDSSTIIIDSNLFRLFDNQTRTFRYWTKKKVDWKEKLYIHIY